MATAEFAVAIPVVVVVLALGLGGLRLGLDELRCQDAARSAVRLLARGESTPAVRAEAVRAGPPGATVTLGAVGDRVSVTVRGRLPITLRGVGLAEPSATAEAVRELGLLPSR
jgi:hypothetical protein